MRNQKTYTVNEATKILENYCAYQERCHKEVEQKLYGLNMISIAKEQIILHLLQHNFLNEERFAKAFVRGKFSIKKWGKVKIINELKFKGISAYNINSGLQEINQEDYLKTIQVAAEKKLNLIKEPTKFKKSTKLATFLISKGFESELVYKIIKDLI